jgi:hypothetical protein
MNDGEKRIKQTILIALMQRKTYFFIINMVAGKLSINVTICFVIAKY